MRRAWRILLHGPAVRQGPLNVPVVAEIAFNPDCPFCHALWVRMQPYRHSPIGIRWLPISARRRSTLGKGAAIVMAHDPLKAQAFNEERFNVARREGGIAPLDHVPPAVRDAIWHDTWCMKRLDGVVPTILFRDKQELSAMVGVPARKKLAGIMRFLAWQERMELAGTYSRSPVAPSGPPG
ncbi:hypothetical protein [Acidiferrobacter sp.]|uniref:hypothetical protein n=1 Tax=Acidiferrobacter sp. TaxID=1872107 RepID=UPI002610FE09|nr:hypothetical protein [Acidiferrobacter sp.]